MHARMYIHTPLIFMRCKYALMTTSYGIDDDTLMIMWLECTVHTSFDHLLNLSGRLLLSTNIDTS